jgi:hypothetical protein
MLRQRFRVAQRLPANRRSLPENVAPAPQATQCDRDHIYILWLRNILVKSLNWPVMVVEVATMRGR